MSGMLRIIGGAFGGRRLKVPTGITVRPTQDRVREALFSSLQDQFPGVWFLDLFAGSGAVGLEALSRGASRVCWVEGDRRVHSILKSNVILLAGEDVAAACRFQDVFAFCRSWRGERGFDIIFADPPYARTTAEGTLAGRLLAEVGACGLLADKGLVIIEQGVREPEAEAEGWCLVRERSYGKSCLRMYRRE